MKEAKCPSLYGTQIFKPAFVRNSYWSLAKEIQPAPSNLFSFWPILMLSLKLTYLLYRKFQRSFYMLGNLN
jgi:hypothetical protein